MNNALQNAGSSGASGKGKKGASGGTTVNVRVSSGKGVQTAYEIKEQEDATGRVIAKKAGKVGG